jgi:hypothetical protein
MLIRNKNHWLLRGSGGDTVAKHRFEYRAMTFFSRTKFLQFSPPKEPGGGSFTGAFEIKRKCILGFLFRGPRGHWKLSLGTIWNFSKGTGLRWADISLWGTKGPFIRPRCVGTERARTQMLINQFALPITIHPLLYIHKTPCDAALSHPRSSALWPVLALVAEQERRFTTNHWQYRHVLLTLLCAHAHFFRDY